MCISIRYRTFGINKTSRFTDPQAQLPYMGTEGRVWFASWGRREDEEGIMPPTGWARLDAVKRGVWGTWNPRPVKIPADHFMERDPEGVPYWFQVEHGAFIQGLLATTDHSDERRIYVVTVPSEGALAVVHDRWPRIVSRPSEAISDR